MYIKVDIDLIKKMKEILLEQQKTLEEIADILEKRSCK